MRKYNYCRNTLKRKEFILPSMTCCCWLINNSSAIFRFVIRLSGYITQEFSKSIRCPSLWWFTIHDRIRISSVGVMPAVRLVLFQSDSQWFSSFTNVNQTVNCTISLMFNIWKSIYIGIIVFWLLKHSDEPPTLLGGAQHFYGGEAPCAPSLVTARRTSFFVSVLADS